jgi:hypothetical protein
MRAHGNDPLADLLDEGPVVVGRFDLRRERMLAPLEIGRAGDRSGVWDVLAHPNGRIFFTTFFELAGYTDPSSGALQRLANLGTGLNELALGPAGSVLASRYDAGSIAHFDPDGALLGEYRLDAPDGYRAAPKTIAYDPLRAEIWVTSDSLPLDPADPMRHESYVLGAAGEPLRRVAEPELQFVRFSQDGTGYRAEVEGRNLWLQISDPGAGPSSGSRLLLDAAFPAALDFVQDIALMRDGRAVVTRWSGWIHVVESPRVVRTTRLPELETGGLYYSAFAERDRICATYCADLSVVCADLP